MTFDPLLAAPCAIQIHVMSALPALLVGPFALFRARRDRVHRWLGSIWIASMLVLSISGLFIASDFALIGPFGAIHLLSIYALWGLAQGLWHIRRGNIAGHRAAMEGIWFGAMGLAGLFTLMPGRRLNTVLFGDSEELGWIVMVLGLAALAILWRGRRRYIRRAA